MSKAASASRTKRHGQPRHHATIDAAARRALIADAAYYRAERRGFVPGFELADWLAAEEELDAQSSPVHPAHVERQSLDTAAATGADLH